MGNCVGGKGKKDPTVLTEEEIKLLLENTKLNRAQINALHQNFLKECPSGKLTKKDFVKLFKEVHPSENKKEKADKFCEYVFKVIDRDSLGYISFNDFVLCFSLTSYGDFKQKCEFAFRLYDLDKDNKISKKEMTQVLVALYDLSGITDRKKDKAPSKKVDEIMKLINHQTELKEKAAAGEAAPEPEDSKAKKGKKSAKKPKQKDFITREQFIDACSEDEALKKLFVDSIFAATTTEPVLEAAVVNSQGDFEGVARNLPVDLNSFALDAPAFEVTTTTKTECVQFTSADAPAVSVEVEAPVLVAEEAPADNVDVKVESTEVAAAPAEEASAAEVVADVITEAVSVETKPTVEEVKVESVEVTTSAPVEVEVSEGVTTTTTTTIETVTVTKGDDEPVTVTAETTKTEIAVSDEAPVTITNTEVTAESSEDAVTAVAAAVALIEHLEDKIEEAQEKKEDAAEAKAEEAPSTEAEAKVEAPVEVEAKAASPFAFMTRVEDQVEEKKAEEAGENKSDENKAEATPVVEAKAEDDDEDKTKHTVTVSSTTVTVSSSGDADTIVDQINEVIDSITDKDAKEKEEAKKESDKSEKKPEEPKRE